MTNWKFMLLAGTMAFAPFGASAAAAPKEAPVAEQILTEAGPHGYEGDAPAGDEEALSQTEMANAKAKMQREMDEAIAMVEKIFGTKDLPPVDPARLALAQRTTASLVPPGSLEKMLDNIYGKIFKGFMEEMGGESDTQISLKTGVGRDEVAALDAKSKIAIADLFDPYRKQREEQVTSIIRPQLSEALGDLEPPMRNGLAHAYARKFTDQQLTEVNGFFATPTGKAFAGESLALQADPEVMVTMVKAVPPMLSKFMDRAPSLERQFKELPKEMQLADLDDKELAKLAKLMKVNIATLKENRDMWGDAAEAVDMDAEAADTMSDDWNGADAAADAADDAADAADAMSASEGYDDMYDLANWSEADRAEYERLSAEWSALGEQMSILSDAAAERARAGPIEEKK